jgi:hypothetical protein
VALDEEMKEKSKVLPEEKVGFWALVLAKP